jgi:hypothetical protein
VLNLTEYTLSVTASPNNIPKISEKKSCKGVMNLTAEITILPNGKDGKRIMYKAEEENDITRKRDKYLAFTNIFPKA